MSETTDQQDARPLGCQAIPGASRRGWRTDLLCASIANTEVLFYGRAVAVCRIHRATYERWGAMAEERAIELWGWRKVPAPPAPS
jgi:hypothetical protein